jgi:spore coat polysaccharide biosynthesis protein SpsF
MKDINVVIQMRLGSSRLPNKGMKLINNKPILDIIINRIRKCNNINKIIIATSFDIKNNPIIEYCISNNIDFYRGSENNVYSRFKDIAIKYNCFNLCRITGDNPLTDYEYLDKYAEIYKNNNYDILTTCGTPIGTTCFEFLNMHKIIKYEKNNDNLEEFMFYFYNSPDFNIKSDIIKIEHELTNNDDLLLYIRLTLDVEEDFIVVEKILNNFKGKEYDVKLIDILNFLKDNKDIILINKDCEKYHYHHHLKKLNINNI